MPSVNSPKALATRLTWQPKTSSSAPVTRCCAACRHCLMISAASLSSRPATYPCSLRTQDHQVIAIVEQADATPSQQEIREVNAGVYAFDIAALRSALSRLSADNAQRELYLSDVIAIVRQDGQAVAARHVDDSSLVAGVNNRVQLSELAAELNRRIVAAHQLAGVTVVDPATTWIDIDVSIGRDTVIQPGTQLLGGTRIGGDCSIGPDTTLTDVSVGDEP